MTSVVINFGAEEGFLGAPVFGLFAEATGSELDLKRGS